MTVSTHVYEAELIGSPDVPLSVIDGSITLDSSRAPHVEATLTIAMPGHWDTSETVPEWVPDPDTLAALDPRETPRVRITATRDGGAPRVFDLGVRRRPIRHANGTITLELASDEAILADYAPLEDDDTPFTLAESLRDVVDHVLRKVGLGNLHPNPSMHSNIDGYAAGSGVTLSWQSSGGMPDYNQPRGGATVTTLGGTTVRGPAIPVIPGQVITVSHYLRTGGTGDNNMSGRTARSRITWLDGPGGTVDAPATVLSNTFQRSVVTAVVPEGVTQMRPDIAINGHASLAGVLVWDWAQVELSPSVTPYRDKALEPTPAHDADLTPYWPVTNLHTNPLVVNTYGYGSGQGASSLTRVTFGSLGAVRWTTDAGTSNLVFTPAPETFRARPGSWYVATINLNSQVARQARVGIQWYSGAGTAPMGTDWGEYVTTDPGNWTTLHVIARAPAGAESLVPFVSTIANSAGQFHYARLPMVYEGNRVVPPFTGEDADDADYEYAWAESTHGSPSVRTPKRDSPDPEALVWRAGQSAIDFLHPLVQAAGLRLVCDEQRRWTLRDEDYRAPGSLTARYGVNIIAATDDMDRDAGFWFDAAVRRYVWRDQNSIEQERIDAFALNDPPTRVSTVEIDAPYPGPGRAEYAVRRAQSRGREVTASMVADWTVHAEQAVSVHLPDAPIQLGITDQIEYDLSTDRMTLTTRTTEVIPLAWVLIPEGEAWLDSPIGESWIEEEA